MVATVSHGSAHSERLQPEKRSGAKDEGDDILVRAVLMLQLNHIRRSQMHVSAGALLFGLDDSIRLGRGRRSSSRCHLLCSV